MPKILEAQFSYNERIENALNRDKNDMYSLLSVPNVSLEQLKGFAASGQGNESLVLGADDEVRGKVERVGRGA